ncbi:nuclear transport factor 2 family protein [Streptomyces sp. NPDC050418]|uniref:nuclear transport factor 2 family protein n=1 Tax=Streptomyces sp. NPDC050418 TaxID=3365612 RepID=UPI0037B8FE81
MAGRGRTRAWGAGVVVTAVLAGCGGPPGAPADSRDVKALLDRRAEAVLARDAAAFRATEADGDAGELDALADVPLSSWTYELTRLVPAGDEATATARLRYRISGYDGAPVTADRTLKLRREDGAWRVASDRPKDKTAQQLWEQGEVEAVRGERSLVLGVGRDPAKLRSYAELADRAVPAVQEVWGKGWSGRVVILVPESLDAMGGLLGAPASGYQGIAAVTTGEAGGTGRTPADRIILNPEAFDELGDFGKQVVLTHETTHVATRSATTAATPLWLSEGLADWLGYRGSGRTAQQAAPELDRALDRSEPPVKLPADDAFAFSSDASRLAQAYESGWLACKMVAERWGDRKLLAFYRAVGEHDGREGAVEDALGDVLRTDLDAFTREWIAYVRAELT